MSVVLTNVRKKDDFHMVLVNFVFQFIIVYSEIPFGKGLYRMEIQSIDLES